MLFYLLAGLLSIIALVCTYGIFIEPRRLLITRHEIVSKHLPEGFHGVKIVQLSDIHIGPHYPIYRLQQLITTLNSLKPDIVVFTGDLFDARQRNNETNNDPTAALAQIHAPLGKFAVYGNHDFGYFKNKRTSGTFLLAAGFKVLVNQIENIKLPNGEFITVAGLDDYLVGKPDSTRTLSRLKDKGYHLLLVHEPDVADSLAARYPIDLQLSGHSHGGQVCLPLAGTLVKTALGRKYVGGMYRIQESRRKKRPYRLYVNRGIGTTRIKIRIGSVPELSVFTLLREK